MLHRDANLSFIAFNPALCFSTRRTDINGTPKSRRRHIRIRLAQGQQLMTLWNH
jgi:hypothetical protein